MIDEDHDDSQRIDDNFVYWTDEVMYTVKSYTVDDVRHTRNEL